MSTTTTPAGAGFLLGDIEIETLATPERLTEEQRMMRETARKFVRSEVVPRIAELEKLNPGLMRELLQKAGELGLCMIDVPEEYGGLGLDFLTSVQVPEILDEGGGFHVAHSVQTVIGALPILYFGSEELKQKYLPKIASVEWVSAYALTEPGSGSDALAAKSTAVLSEDGKAWILNGTKQFISNGGFADVFIVFAKVDGQHFSAFVVEKDAPGFSVGAEEHKLGIKSSSTTTLAFQDCRIPKENLIGEIGWGGKIALNCLNVGRLKLGSSAMGAAKEALECATQYALERQQFGQPIANFGIIREKIAEMAARTYAAESSVMRTTGYVTAAVEASAAAAGGRTPEAMMAALRTFNAECSIDKVHGSETQMFCVDEAVQIHGGYGFIEEYKVARLYRDARISRLYEGTNEINRMQIAGDILRRVTKGELTLQGETSVRLDAGTLADVADQVRRQKRAVGKLIGLVAKIAGSGASKAGGDQELLQRLADIIIAIYATESAMGRALQAKADGCEHAETYETLTRVYAAGAGMTVLRSAREAARLLCDLAGGESVNEEAVEIESLAAAEPTNVIALRRKAAQVMIERRGEWFE
jgi:alkylation response protein AidB-like acyl-CoA dehydrogenase